MHIAGGMRHTWVMASNESVIADHAADRRLALAAATLVVLETILAFLADSDTIGLVVWLVLAIAAVGVTVVLAAGLQARAEHLGVIAILRKGIDRRH